VGGSSANGAVTLTTSGSFITSGAGASSFYYTGGTGLTIVAVGTITPGAGSLSVVKGLSVTSPATKDLSQLKLATDLYGIPPTNNGTGTYIPPQ
jgi:hypothetical protein